MSSRDAMGLGAYVVLACCCPPFLPRSDPVPPPSAFPGTCRQEYAQPVAAPGGPYIVSVATNGSTDVLVGVNGNASTCTSAPCRYVFLSCWLCCVVPPAVPVLTSADHYSPTTNNQRRFLYAATPGP